MTDDSIKTEPTAPRHYGLVDPDLGIMSPTVAKLATALAKAQAEIKDPKKNKTNPHFKNKYADLSAVLESVRPAFSKQGLSLAQFFDGRNFVTLLLHNSGEWIKGTIKVQPDREGNVQALGSWLTYIRRYTAGAIAGIAPDDDDDGNVAARPTAKPAAKPAAKPTAAKPAAPAAPIAAIVAKLTAAKTSEELEAVVAAAKKMDIGAKDKAVLNKAYTAKAKGFE